MCFFKSRRLIFTIVLLIAFSRVELLDISTENKVTTGTLNATEQLLELLVKISANPNEWNNALNLIEKDVRHKNIAIFNKQQNSLETNIQEDLEELRDLEKARKKPWYFYTYSLKPRKAKEKNNSDHKQVGSTFTNNAKLRKTFSAMPNLENKVKNEYLNYLHLNQKRTSQIKKYSYVNKRPKAYIAVSVIAQKPLREDTHLDQELKYLKMWPQQKLEI